MGTQINRLCVIAVKWRVKEACHSIPRLLQSAVFRGKEMMQGVNDLGGEGESAGEGGGMGGDAYDGKGDVITVER